MMYTLCAYICIFNIYRYHDIKTKLRSTINVSKNSECIKMYSLKCC